ncbi:MAG: protein TolQ [Alphaproteobacteria bacterium]|nr:protein TolQ [Alphaproteobacteria bacterium]
MEQQIVDQLKLPGSVPHTDMSALGLFMHADGVVKMVILALVFASIWTWAIILQKSTKLKNLKSKAVFFEDRFWAGGSLDTLYDKVNGKPGDPMSSIFVAAMKEWKSAAEKNLMATAAMRTSLLARIERAINGTIGRELTQIEKHMTWLASVGSVSTFVGLFGTVWGIMNSFAAIANSQNTSLAVVAPGIAEALFATAIGLVAAIPAVLAYNKFNSEISRYAERLDFFGNDLLATMSRNLEDM